MPVHAALSLMLDGTFAAASAPLFEAELVDALLWSPDVGFRREIPEWSAGLLDHYAGAGRLSAHGVGYSPFTARFEPRQKAWLEHLSAEMQRRRYVRFSEHFGFTTSEPFDRGAPMPVPYCDAAIAAGAASLARLQDATGGLPMGLENLALAFSPFDVDAQGAFLRGLLGDGFVVLDLHNLWCQSVNFSRAPLALLASYPLERVREIHVAGGRWSYPRTDPERRSFRRDTHDGAVPERVFELLAVALAHCRNVEMVVLEALPVSLQTEPARERFRADFRRLREVLASPPRVEILPSPAPAPPPFSASTDDLARVQTALLTRLHSGLAPDAVRESVAAEHPAFAEWLRAAEPRTLEVAIELAATWGGASATIQEAG